MGPFDFLADIATVYAIIQASRDTLKALRRRGVLSDAQNTWADVRMKARGHLLPTIIERLDDGTDPEHQHLSLDIGPAFPEERIQKALYYWSSQSFDNMVNAFWADVKAQALRGAHEGEKRTSTIIMDLLEGFQYIAVIRGQVGGKWEIITDQKQLSLRKMWASALAKSDLLHQMRKEAREKHKAIEPPAK